MSLYIYYLFARRSSGDDFFLFFVVTSIGQKRNLFLTGGTRSKLKKYMSFPISIECIASVSCSNQQNEVRLPYLHCFQHRERPACLRSKYNHPCLMYEYNFSTISSHHQLPQSVRRPPSHNSWCLRLDSTTTPTGSGSTKTTAECSSPSSNLETILQLAFWCRSLFETKTTPNFVEVADALVVFPAAAWLWRRWCQTFPFPSRRRSQLQSSPAFCLPCAYTPEHGFWTSET